MQSTKVPHELETLQNQIMNNVHPTEETPSGFTSKEFSEFQKYLSWKSGNTSTSNTKKTYNDSQVNSMRGQIKSLRSKVNSLQKQLNYTVGLLSGSIQDKEFVSKLRSGR